MFTQSIKNFLIIAFYTVAFIYVVACAFQTIENLELLGATMLFTPSFTVSNLVRKDRRYSKSDRLRNYVGLHTPIYRVLNHAQRFILDSRIHRDFDMHTNRGQQKWIYREGVLNIRLDRGYSAVSIGARTIFAVDEWTRTIYHIDASGRLAVTDYFQDYDMSDVIAQVTEALEVIAEHYDADKHDAMERRYEWQLDCTENVEGVRDYKRATVKCWFVKASSKSVEWRKQWMRETPSGSTQWKITEGSHPTAYQVVIGSTAYWLPHSILSREWELHGGRTFKSDHSVPYFQFNGTVDSIDLPVWWLKKNVAYDDVAWTDLVEPVSRDIFFKKWINKRPRRRWAR